MIISLREAMARVGEKQAMSGKEFCDKYRLSMLETNIRHGNGQACLFDADEVDNIAKTLREIQNAQGKVYLKDEQVTRTEFLDAVLRVERKIDRLLRAFDLPDHDS